MNVRKAHKMDVKSESVSNTTCKAHIKETFAKLIMKINLIEKIAKLKFQSIRETSILVKTFIYCLYNNMCTFNKKKFTYR